MDQPELCVICPSNVRVLSERDIGNALGNVPRFPKKLTRQYWWGGVRRCRVRACHGACICGEHHLDSRVALRVFDGQSAAREVWLA